MVGVSTTLHEDILLHRMVGSLTYINMAGKHKTATADVTDNEITDGIEVT